jgi:hypothetical protein
MTFGILTPAGRFVACLDLEHARQIAWLTSHELVSCVMKPVTLWHEFGDYTIELPEYASVDSAFSQRYEDSIEGAQAESSGR